MTENMITVALIIGDPGREDPHLSEGSLAAAAKMTGFTARLPTAGGTRAGGAVADQEPEVRGPVKKVHEQVADLLGGPRAVRVGGDP